MMTLGLISVTAGWQLNVFTQSGKQTVVHMRACHVRTAMFDDRPWHHPGYDLVSCSSRAGGLP